MDELFCKSVKLFHYQAFPMILGAWDHFNFDEVLSELPAKTSHNSLVETPQLVKALVVQLCDTLYQSIWGTAEYYSKAPIPLMFNDVNSHVHFKRNSLARMLDVVYEFGPERLFIKASKTVFDILDLSPKSLYVDKTLFQYDEKSKEDPACMLRVCKGYSQDHRPDLKQVIELHAVDDEYGIPMFAKAYSGNISDKESLLDFCSSHVTSLRNTYDSLTRIVGDSAICTQKIFDEVNEKGLFVVTRIPDSFSLTKECYELSEKKELVPLPQLNKCRDSYQCCWIKGKELFGYPVKLLVLKNGSERARKTKKIRTQAEKELSLFTKELRKLNRKKPKCEPDAIQLVEKLCSKLKFVTISNVTYSQIESYAKPGKPSPENEKIVTGIEISATAELNEAAIEDAINQECNFVICTTDVKHDWTMEELHGAYSRQSFVENKWRMSNDPRHFIDAIYLQKPSRITSLMWLMSMAILLVSVIEMLLNTKLKDKKIRLPDLEPGNRANTLTYDRVHRCLKNSYWSIMVINNKPIFSEIDLSIIKMFKDLGPSWSKYVDLGYIEEKLLKRA